MHAGTIDTAVLMRVFGALRAAVQRCDERAAADSLSALRFVLESRGVVMGLLRRPDETMFGIGLVVLPTERFARDWRAAVPCETLACSVDAIACVHRDGRLEVVKNRHGRRGFVPGCRLPCRPGRGDRYLATEVTVTVETMVTFARPNGT